MHGINQAHTVDEFTFAGAPRFVESLQIFGRHGEIRVEDHEQFAGRLGKPQPDRVSFPLAGLAEKFRAPFRPTLDLPFDRLISVVMRVALDKDQFGTCAEGGSFLENAPDIARFVARRNNHAHHRLAILGLFRLRACHQKIRDSHPAKQSQLCQIAITEDVHPRGSQRPNDFREPPNGLKSGQVQQVFEVFLCQPVLAQLGFGQA